ncbi:hypothetical protein [Bacillus mycoides]|nr:hypothetical protein [Bacillus mycoides]SCC67234.1 Uncharacterized protein BW664_05739 [Bacillus mycoides]
MRLLDNLTQYISNQETFIKIGFYTGAGLLIVFIGYLVGQFSARIIG